MDDRVLALCELSNDLLYHKIPQEKLSYFIDSSLLAGKTTADEFKNCNIESLYKEYDIAIRYYEKSSERFGVTFRGQSVMSKKECSVELYRLSIQELSRYSGYQDQMMLSYEMALQVHLAHEFFHILEYKRGAFVSEKLEQIQTFKMPFYTKNVHINRCSEIAAHAFAERMLGLPVLPNFYDYLYLIHMGKITQNAFDDMLENNRKILQGSLES